MEEQGPALLVILTAAAVNLRMAVYSASIAAQWRGVPLGVRLVAGYCLHDQAFALSMRRYAKRPNAPMGDKVGYYLGVGFGTLATWVGSSYAGFALGAAIPDWLSLDFAAPVIFIAVVAPMILGAAHASAASVGATVSLLCAWAPFSLGVLIGGAAGVATGVMVERWIAAPGDATANAGDGA